ncbi:ubiquitin 3 binding protein But2 C-terminal domain-containing protein [Xylaria sp. FL1042]|nr:ubiquitin 3 binding protein But2 C-terminal domain-containing protein [Xylaria sp. FL1042]
MLVPLVAVVWLHSLLDPVDAHATRDNVGCAFHLSCSGAFNGSVGEKSSGQARAGSDVVSPSLFTWFGDAFTDQQSSGCWWTPPTFTLQCDKNQPPDHGFQIGCDGALSFNGQSVFYECPTGVGDEVNIYLHPNGGQCHEITIQADNCAPSTCPGGGIGPGGGGTSPGPGATNSPTSSSGTTPSTLATSITTSSSSNSNAPSSPSSSTSQGPPTPSPFTTAGDQTTKTSITSTSTITTTQTPTPSSTSSCVEIGPEQIILTDLGNPDTAYGPNTAQHIQVSPNASSIFNFRFDDADRGKTCRLSFRLPSSSTTPSTSGQGPPSPGGFTFGNLTGTGVVAFAALEGWADADTTYHSMPRVVQTLGDVVLRDGVDVAFPEFPCPGAMAKSAVLLSEGPLADTCLDCVQGGDVGLFLRKC